MSVSNSFQNTDPDSKRADEDDVGPQEDSVDTAAVVEPRALPVAQNTQPPGIVIN